MDAEWGAGDVGRVPLFDRLVDEDPHREREGAPLRTYSRDELYGSIRRELLRMLSTRCPLPGDRALSQERTVLDYGLPDLDIGGRSLIPEDRRRIARLIRSTIEAYEPRLKNVEVDVVKIPERGERLLVTIQAMLILDRVKEPLLFTLGVGDGADE